MATVPTSGLVPYGLREGVKVLCRRDGAILLVKEEHADGTPFWTLPGGGVDADESLQEALRRELREELQCAVTAGERIGRMWYRHSTQPATVTRYAVFEGSVKSSPEPNPDQGVQSYRWVKNGSVPARTLSCVERFLRRAVSR